MKKKAPKKLTLGRETLRTLTSAQLGRVGGGSYYPSEADGCGSDSSEPAASGTGGGGSGYISYLP